MEEEFKYVPKTGTDSEPSDSEELVGSEKVVEPTVTFKTESDRTVLNIISEDNNEVLVEISGYDLRIMFNLAHLKSIEDIEAATDGIKRLFTNVITEKLLEYTKEAQPQKDE